MNPLAPIVWENSRLARRITRILSLLLVGFFLSLVLFNDDVRTDPTWPFFLLGLVVLSISLAWRWEKEGGMLSMILALLFSLSILINALLNNQFPLLAVVFGTLLLGFPFFMVGWLFYTLGQPAGRYDNPDH